MALLLTNHHFFRARVLITLDGPRDADYKSISTQTLAVPQCKHCNFVAHQKNPNFKYQKRDEGKQLFSAACAYLLGIHCERSGGGGGHGAYQSNARLTELGLKINWQAKMSPQEMSDCQWPVVRLKKTTTKKRPVWIIASHTINTIPNNAAAIFLSNFGKIIYSYFPKWPWSIRGATQP